MIKLSRWYTANAAKAPSMTRFETCSTISSSPIKLLIMVSNVSVCVCVSKEEEEADNKVKMSFQNLKRRNLKSNSLGLQSFFVLFRGTRFASFFVTTREFQEGRTRNAARGVVNLSLSNTQRLSLSFALFVFVWRRVFCALREAVLTVRSVN